MESIQKNLEKVGSSIYNLFDHLYIKIVIITILVIYNSGLFIDFNLQLSSIFNNTILRLIILIIIVAISSKNITIPILLILALATSSYYKQENFENPQEEKEKEKEDEEEKSQKQKPKRRPQEKFANPQLFMQRLP